MKFDFLLTAMDGENAKNPRISGLVYNGGALRLGWGAPVYVDLSGIETAQQVVLLANHENTTDSRIGVLAAMIKDNAIWIDGEITSREPVAANILEQASKPGADWQASIGASPIETEYVDRDVVRVINGSEVTGPFYHVKKSILKEVSVVAVGADSNTKLTIQAEFKMERPKMGKEKENTQSVTSEQTVSAANPPASVPDVQATAKVNDVNAKDIAEGAVKAERERIAKVSEICGKDFPEIQAQAIKEGWDENHTNAVVLAAYREKRPHAPNVFIAGKSFEGESFESTITAAALIAGGMQGETVIKHTSEKAVSAAQKKFRHSISLCQIFLEAAWKNGYTGFTVRGYEADVLKAAFSSSEISGILSNVANKFLLSSFMSTEQVWRQIAKFRAVQNFQTVTSYRLNGNMKFERIAPGGEIKHGTLGETSFTNKADTYGKMFSIDRRDIINDDLGALTEIPQMIGRGSGLTLNEVFWTEFLADAATFFSTAHKNLITGTASALSIEAMSAARTKFAKQVDENGNPLGIVPAICLVPVELEDSANQLYSDTQVNESPTDKPKLASNPNKGKLRPVASQYLSAASIAGSSATAWYTLANPSDIPVIEIALLNGNQSPVIESTSADFDTLGVKFRGYFDFGVSKQDFRAAVKSTGVN